MTTDKQPLLTRIWQAITAWENAMDGTAQDYVLARLETLENEVVSLKTEVHKRPTSHDVN